MELEYEETGVETDVDNEFAGQILKKIRENTDLREITLVAGIGRQRYVILMLVERKISKPICREPKINSNCEDFQFIVW